MANMMKIFFAELFVLLWLLLFGCCLVVVQNMLMLYDACCCCMMEGGALISTGPRAALSNASDSSEPGSDQLDW